MRWRQGVGPQDAIAALVACEGHAQDALALAADWKDRGGYAQRTRQEVPEAGRRIEAWAQMAEAQLVLQRFAVSGMR